MLFPNAPPINHTRVLLSFGLAVPIFAALGRLATFTTGAPLWKGLAAGAVVGGFIGLLFSGLAPRLITAVFGPRDAEAGE